MAGTALARCGPPWLRAASVTSAPSQGSWLCRAGTRRSAWERVCAELSPRSEPQRAFSHVDPPPPSLVHTDTRASGEEQHPGWSDSRDHASVKWLRPHIVTGKLFSRHSLYMHIYVYMYASAYVHVCMNVCVCRCVYIYIFMHLYTYTRSGHTYKMYIGSPFSFYET